MRRVWEALRRKRKEVSDRSGVKAYKIAHDRSLWEMAVNRPLAPVDLLRSDSGFRDKGLGFRV